MNDGCGGLAVVVMLYRGSKNGGSGCLVEVWLWVCWICDKGMMGFPMVLGSVGSGISKWGLFGWLFAGARSFGLGSGRG